MVAYAHGRQIVAAGVIVVEAHAPVALDAPIHLVIQEGPEILVVEGPLGGSIAAMRGTGHDGHVLEMTFSSLVADRAVVRVARHEPLSHRRPEGPRFRVVDGDAGALLGRSQAGHHDLALGVVLIFELLHGALAAGPD